MPDISQGMNQMIREHIVRRPRMQIQDVYKLIYQGVCGPEHLITSKDAFAMRLLDEWAGVKGDDTEPLWESIRPDASLARLNLLPYKTRGGSVDYLLRACLQAAEQTWGNKDELKRVWISFMEVNHGNTLSFFPEEEIISFTAWLNLNDYPSVHHTECYRSLYHPAYRLVSCPLDQLDSWLIG